MTRPKLMLLLAAALALAGPIHLALPPSVLDLQSQSHQTTNVEMDSSNKNSADDGPCFDNSDYIPSQTESAARVLDVPRPLSSTFLMSLDDSVPSDSDFESPCTEAPAIVWNEELWTMEKLSSVLTFLGNLNMCVLFIGFFIVALLALEIFLIVFRRSSQAKVKLHGRESQLYARVDLERCEGKNENVETY